MFTGIITACSEITGMRNNAENIIVAVRRPSKEADTWEAPISIGESITFDGVCSTVITITDEMMEVEWMPETLRLTNLGEKQIGDKLNLERSITAQDMLSGHIVQGHVDGTGTVHSVEADGEESYIVTISHDKAYDKFIIQKGSITMNGISLTVINPKPGQFSIAIIPHTWEHTNIHTFEPGMTVNLEYDVLAKYLERLLSAREEQNA